MSHGGIISKISIKEHEGLDNLLIGTCIGYQVLVKKGTPDGAVGILFPAGCQLSHEFCVANKLYKKDPITLQPAGGYLEPSRRIKTLKLRGIPSEGIWLSLDCLKFITSDLNFKIGEELNELKGVPLSRKYVSPATNRAINKRNNFSKGQKKYRHPSFPTFYKHYDTPQLRHNIARIPEGSIIYITEKLHGTSGRSGYHLAEIPYNGFARTIRSLFRLPLSTFKWETVVGTRNVVLVDNTAKIKTFNANYEDLSYRRKHHNNLALKKGETIYYEIVGWSSEATRIMPAYNLGSDPVEKEIKKRFSDVIDFDYGQAPGTSQIYIYRITQTAEDGHVIELPWTLLTRRCEELGVKHVPLVMDPVIADKGFLDNLPTLAKDLCEPSSTLSNSIREGICVRVEHKDCFHTFKYKSFWFSHLEGISKNDDGYIDLEEIS